MNKTSLGVMLVGNAGQFLNVCLEANFLKSSQTIGLCLLIYGSCFVYVSVTHRVADPDPDPDHFAGSDPKHSS